MKLTSASILSITFFLFGTSGDSLSASAQNDPTALICESDANEFRDDLQQFSTTINHAGSGTLSAQPIYVNELYASYDSATRELYVSVSTSNGLFFKQEIVLLRQEVAVESIFFQPPPADCVPTFFNQCVTRDYGVKVRCWVQ